MALARAASTLLLKIKRSRVHAIPLARWRRSVRKYVPEMRVAFLTANFRTRHAESPVGCHFDVFLGNGRPETRPASARFEFGLGTEQRIAAAHASVDPLIELIVVLASECSLRAGVACYFKLRLA